MNHILQWVKLKIKHHKLGVLVIVQNGKSHSSFDLYILKNKKGKLGIEKHAEDPCSVKDVKTGIPVYLHLSGDGVMVRTFPGHISKDNLQKLMPNFLLKDYYVHFDYLENNSVVSIARKDMVEQIVQKAQCKDCCLSGIFLGPSPLIGLSEYLDTSLSSIDVGSYRLLLTGGKITGTEKGELCDPIYFMNQSRDQKEVYALSSGILASIYPLKYTLQDNIFLQGSNEATFALLGRKSLGIVAVFLFLVLLLNFFLFEQQYQKKSILEAEILTRENLLSQLSSLKRNLEQKRLFINSNSLSETYVISYIYDQFGQLADEGVNFEKICINPLNHINKQSEPLSFRRRIITINGNALDMESYQQFLSKIQEKDWCQEISYQDYSFKPGKQSASFQLEILFKNVVSIE